MYEEISNAILSVGWRKFCTPCRP